MWWRRKWRLFVEWLLVPVLAFTAVGLLCLVVETYKLGRLATGHWRASRMG